LLHLAYFGSNMSNNGENMGSQIYEVCGTEMGPLPPERARRRGKQSWSGVDHLEVVLGQQVRHRRQGWTVARTRGKDRVSMGVQLQRAMR